MTVAPDVGAERVLAERLATVHEVLGGRAADGEHELIDTLGVLIERVRSQARPSASWLLIVGLTGAYPDADLVRRVLRGIMLRATDEAARWVLQTVTPLAMEAGNAEATLRVVRDRPVVDVNATAKSDFLTGIQRVVRGTAARWHETHDVELVVWTANGGAMRALHPDEEARLLQQEAVHFDPSAQQTVEDHAEIVVPWGVPIALLEVPAAPQSLRMAAVAELTDSSVRLVGYDCIPMSSAETVPLVEPFKFGHYLELVKYADAVAGISHTAAAEFTGFTRALSAQGLTGPQVVACPLPHTIPVPGLDATHHPDTRRPLVVCIGTVGRRKNQAALVEAAEMLWREGVDFEVRILGHVSSERNPFVDLVAELRRAGRPLSLESGVSDARIATSLSHARCLVFPSLHEGFGLPIVEALSHGVPVITSDFGSLREVAEGQGGLLVDPEDVGAIAEALRSLLTNDAVHARLVAEAATRPQRSWAEYATDLWKALLA